MSESDDSINSQFLDVLGILSKHGHEIMVATANSRRSKKDYCTSYDCLHGNYFLSQLFNAKSNYLDSYNPKGLKPYVKPIRPGYIYHFRLITDVDEDQDEEALANMGMLDQVHYFTILYDKDKTLLFQTLGGVKDILVKPIYGDINVILKNLMREDAATFQKLFEVPYDMRALANYHFVSLDYVQQKLNYPNLESLSETLSEIDPKLDFADKKIINMI